MLEFDSELYFRVTFFAILIPLGSGVCIDLDLGLENERISDGNITASSVQNASTPAKNGRLNYRSGSSWCAGTSDTNPYLQIDLQTLHIICAVSTQGNSQADQWVKTYKLQFSINGTTWTDYKEAGQVKFFMGNDDRNSVVKYVVYELLTRYLRFLPQTHQGRVCMRTEVFGVKQMPENLALRKATAQSSTFNNTADNAYGVSGNAVDGNPDTNFLKGSCSHTTKENPSWWRVDLGSDHVDVSEIHIVNRFSQHVVTEDYKITFGSSPNVVGNTPCGGLYDFHNFTASAVCFTNPLKTGRYVGILTTKEQSLQLCEVEVYSRENLAFQKPTYQHSWTVSGGTSEKAVDGNSNMIFADGSCTFGAHSNFPWWRVDLGQDEFVTEVYLVNIKAQTRLSKFEIRVGTVSSINDTSMTSPKCGRAATHYLSQAVGLSFFCRPSLKGRYVTIRDLRGGGLSGFNLCEVEVYSEQRACHSQAIGVTSSDAIPDGSFSASSKANDGRGPSAGRLNGNNRGWAPKTNTNHTDYLQIDLQYDYVICAVATQGAVNNDQWTTKYKIKLSLDGVTFNTYKENKTEKVFNGNSGRNDIVKHGLREYTLARFIRFVPTDYHGYKTLRVEVYGVLLSTVPSQVPGNLTVTAISSTSIKASWASLPEYARHGDITGYKLFYRQKGSVDNLVMDSVTGAETLTKDFTNLNKYTKYEFQVLAVGSRGEGPKSSVKVEQTLEDAPTIPSNLSQSEIMPDKQVGPKIKLTWYKPAEENGIIRSYTVFYSHNEDPYNIHTKTLKQNMFSYTVDVLGGAIYQFHVRAATIKPGPNATLSVAVNDYEPSVAPNDVSFSRLNQTTFNISWSPLTRKESYSKVISYEVKISLVLFGSRQKRSPANSKTVNTTKAFVILYDIQPCYNVYVRAYTKAGPGPYGQPLPLELIPGAPNNLRATDSQSTEMKLEWLRPQPAMEEKWKVEYSGKKSYNNSFLHEGSKDVQGTTKYTLDNLVPDTKYDLRVYGISKCGNNGFPSSLEVETKIGEPLAPVVLSLTTRKVAELQAEIDLWPAEQRNGPISAYQIIILKVSDCVQELPKDFHLKLKDLNDENLNFHPFHIAAEIENDPVHEKSWKFTIGDGKWYGTFINKELRKGGNYFAYQRAITRFNGQILEGYASKVASISVTPESLKYSKETIKGDTSESQVFRAAVIALCCIVFFLLIVIGALIWRLRRTELNKKATTVNSGIPAPSGGHQVSEPGVYMELHPRPSEGKSREPTEYQSLQDTQVTSSYYNVGFKKERSGKKDGGIYENSHS